MRTWGAPPYRTVVVHGGPGARGEMAPVARALARGRGVLEPFQTRATIDGLVAELRERIGAPPAAVVGYSWGAWLACLLAARHPESVERLVLVSSGPFEERFVPEFRAERRRRYEAARPPGAPAFEALSLAELGAWCAKLDAFDPLPAEDDVEFDEASAEAIWKEAAELRRSGRLLEETARVACPVAAIHGAHDPHAARGVEEPLRRALRDFHFVLLDRCGHTPWLERQAREEFFRALEEALR